MAESFPIEFGRYQLVERLAVGGMAELFKAEVLGEHGSRKPVVIKRLLPHLAADAHFTGMFVDEARLTTRLVHPKIAQTLEFGQADGQLFMAIEYIDGLDVLSVLRECAHRRAQLAPALAVFITHEVLEALDYAHRQTDDLGRPLGIVHRDVSPSNIVISRAGEVKLIDFGIARAAERGQNTRAGTLKGKYGYMSPEQVVGGHVDARSDLFSTGIVLAEMAMGRRLFTAPNELDVLLMVRDVKLDRLDRFGVELDGGLASIIRSALRKEPAARVPSAAAFRDRLADWLLERRVRVGPDDLSVLIGTLYDGAVARRRRFEGPAELAAGELTGEASPLEPTPELPPSPVPEAVAPGNEPSSSIIIDFSDLVVPEEPRAPAREEAPTPPLGVVRADEILPPPATVDVGDAGSAAGAAAAGLADTAPHPALDFEDLLLDEKTPPPSRPRTPTEEDLERAARSVPPPLEEIAEGADEEGDIAQRSGLRLLYSYSAARANGLLQVRKGSALKAIYFTAGTPIFVSSNVPSELFGEHLVGQKVISSGELAMALAMMPHYGGKLGDTLVGLGLMKPLDVFRHLSRQVRDKLVDVCTWAAGSYGWWEGRRNPREAFPLDLDAFEVLGAGARSLSYDMVTRWAGAHGDDRLRSAKVDRVTPERFKLGSQVRDVYNGLDGRRSVGELMGRYTDDLERIRFLQVLYLLVETELAHWEA